MQSSWTDIDRHIEALIEAGLAHFPAIAITGPRQAGKSTLAQRIVQKKKNAVHLDLEYPPDREKLADPALFFFCFQRPAGMSLQNSTNAGLVHRSALRH